MRALWTRFWARSWKVKGPVIGGVVILAAIVGGAAAGSGDDDGGPAPASNETASGTVAAAETGTATSTVSAATTTATATATPSPRATATPTATRVPPTPTPVPPTPTPTIPPGYQFGSGQRQVGTEVVAGATYRTRTGSDNCYWERLSGFGGTLDDIEANENTDGPAVVTIGAGDVGFNSRRCGTWTQDLSPITAGPDEPFGDGTYIVGVDINPGLWKSDGGDSCYWARLRGFSGTLRDIIANDNVDGPALVQINAGDRGFLSSSRCGTWRRQ